MPRPFWKQLLKVLLAALIGLSYGAIIGGAITYLTVNVFKYGISDQPPAANNLLQAFANFFTVLGNALALMLLPLIGMFYGAISSAVIVLVALLLKRGRLINLLIGAIGGTILCVLVFVNSSPGDPLRLCSLIGLPFLTIVGWLVTTMLTPLFSNSPAGESESPGTSVHRQS